MWTQHQNVLIMAELPLLEKLCQDYQPKPAPHFNPSTIILARGSSPAAQQHGLVEAICAVYPQARVLEKFNLPHNRIDLGCTEPLALHYRGKSTLVFGEHKSPLRCSDEDCNMCPNYWHFSPYSFCPYDCKYCYLAGTPGVKFSPTVKIFLNLWEILNRINQVASQLAEPTAFYLGKLQDALALDPLTGYSRIIIPFFAQQEHARLILLTKSANVENLLDLDHQNHTIVSWSLNPPEVSSIFESNLPSPGERIAAMRKCAQFSYPLRAVIMPIIPVSGWQKIYADFLKSLLESVPLNRITLGQICSYPTALKLAEHKLGANNPISGLLSKNKSKDGRIRFHIKLRLKVYKYLIETIKEFQPRLDIGLCMEESIVFNTLDMPAAVGRCNCVL